MAEYNGIQTYSQKPAEVEKTTATISIQVPIDDAEWFDDLRSILKILEESELEFWLQAAKAKVRGHKHLLQGRQLVDSKGLLDLVKDKFGIEPGKEMLYHWRKKHWKLGTHYFKSEVVRGNTFTYDWRKLEPWFADLAKKREGIIPWPKPKNTGRPRKKPTEPDKPKRKYVRKKPVGIVAMKPFHT